MRKLYFLLFLVAFLHIAHSLSAQNNSSSWFRRLLAKEGHPLLETILNNPDSFQYQIIYTRIDRDKNNNPSFRNYYLNVDRGRYFYPASTVKLPVALLALERLNELQIPGLDMHTPMLVDSATAGQTAAHTDSTSKNGLPSVAHYVKKIFVVSDNDAYNRLYEFLGQQAINERLWKKGYPDIRISHRFVPRTREQNRTTNPVRFVDGEQVLYKQDLQYSRIVFDTTRKYFLGRRYLDNNEKVVDKPMDFTLKNRLPLEDLQQLLQSVVFPNSVPEKSRFDLSDTQRDFVLRHMSQYPFETKYPAYDTNEFFQSYTKFFFFRDRKSPIPPSIRIFNKAGWSYGFLSDAAYVVDFENKVEFMLCAVIYVNSDGTLNDDKYDSEEVGWPFFQLLGATIYDHELSRKRKHKPNLAEFVFKYNEE